MNPVEASLGKAIVIVIRERTCQSHQHSCSLLSDYFLHLSAIFHTWSSFPAVYLNPSPFFTPRRIIDYVLSLCCVSSYCSFVSAWCPVSLCVSSSLCSKSSLHLPTSAFRSMLHSDTYAHDRFFTKQISRVFYSYMQNSFSDRCMSLPHLRQGSFICIVYFQQ